MTPVEVVIRVRQETPDGDVIRNTIYADGQYSVDEGAHLLSIATRPGQPPYTIRMSGDKVTLCSDADSSIVTMLYDEAADVGLVDGGRGDLEMLPLWLNYDINQQSGELFMAFEVSLLGEEKYSGRIQICFEPA